MSRPSDALFDSLADHYDEHFAAPRRAAYDRLAWEIVTALLPDPPGVVIDAGCGTGRWAARLARMGHRVIGIEAAPRMAGHARRWADDDSLAFAVREARMEDVDLPPGEADLVLAMGSLQYADDPTAVVQRFASWVRPGGGVAVLVDSLVALVLELLARGEHDDARQRTATRLGCWDAGTGAPPAALHLFDRRAMEDIFIAAGLGDVRSRGLLVSSSALGPAGLEKALSDDLEATMARERQLADEPALADVGKQLLVTGRRPPVGAGTGTGDRHPSR